MTSRQRILRALAGEPLDRPPLWIMRQAGRYLPEYRALKSKHDFVEMVRTPELAREVTLQPLRRFPLDAAIVFSDILVVPEAMGQPYGFRDQGGIQMEYALRTPEQVDALQTEGAAERLAYVGQALSLLRQDLGEETALLGFCGSPWTLACYAIEGGSSEGFPNALAFAENQPAAFESLMEKFTRTLIDYLRMQARSGADAIQIFDTWGALCPDPLYENLSLRWIRRLVNELRSELPVILYAKDSGHRLDALATVAPACLALDHSLDLAQAKTRLPADVSVQGNLDPALLDNDPQTVRAAAQDLLTRMAPHPGHVFNLGHGIRPTAKIPCVEALVETVAKEKA